IELQILISCRRGEFHHVTLHTVPDIYSNMHQSHHRYQCDGKCYCHRKANNLNGQCNKYGHTPLNCLLQNMFRGLVFWWVKVADEDTGKQRQNEKIKYPFTSFC